MPRHAQFHKKKKIGPEHTRLAGAGLFLLLWLILARIVDHPILLPGPWAVLKSLFGLFGRSDFWQSLGLSLLSIVTGFFAALILALGAGILAYFIPPADLFFAPLLSICRSAPLAALTIILMIWLSPSSLPFVLILLAVTPLIYADTKAGLAAASPELLETAFVFRFRKRDRFRCIYLPSLKRQLLPALEFTAGLAWKAGITGEILALPTRHLGTGLYEAKIQLESAEVLAHLAVIVFLSRLLAKVLILLLQHESRREAAETRPASADQTLPARAGALPTDAPEIETSETSETPKTPETREATLKKQKKETAETALKIRDLSKSYDGKTVINELSADIPAGRITFVLGPSGRGKTTLFRILAGLEAADSGRICFSERLYGSRSLRFGVSFQDGRLLENESGQQNLLLVSGAETKEEKARFLEKWEKEMRRLGLPPEQKVRYYSGGMKQKLSLLRT